MTSAVAVEPEEFRKMFEGLRAELGRVIIGQEQVVELLLVAFFAGGHVLLEGVPGLGKTLLAKSFAQLMGLSFKRIQCTPDLMPADILGTQLVVDQDGRKDFGVALFLHVKIEHEIEEGAFQPGPPPQVEGEAGAGDLGASSQVQDPERLAEVPVRFRREGEAGLSFEAPDLDVPRGARAVRDPGRGRVGDAEQETLDVRIGPLNGLLELHDLRVEGFRAFPRASLSLGEGFGELALLVPEFLEIGQGLPASPVGLKQGAEGLGMLGALAREGFPEALRVLSETGEVEHERP